VKRSKKFVTAQVLEFKDTVPAHPVYPPQKSALEDGSAIEGLAHFKGQSDILMLRLGTQHEWRSIILN
jgi:hypothetical protein